MSGSDSAFPVGRNEGQDYIPGLTKGELFAAMAMQATLTNADLLFHLNRKYADLKISFESGIAQFSKNIADVLLAELEKSK